METLQILFNLRKCCVNLRFYVNFLLLKTNTKMHSNPQKSFTHLKNELTAENNWNSKPNSSLIRKNIESIVCIHVKVMLKNKYANVNLLCTVKTCGRVCGFDEGDDVSHKYLSKCFYWFSSRSCYLAQFEIIYPFWKFLLLIPVLMLKNFHHHFTPWH